MGIASGIGRLVSAPLLLFNLLLTIIVLGIAGRVLDNDISSGSFQGNSATRYLVEFALITGAVLIAAYITGLHHLWHWRSGSGGAAQATSWIGWLLLAITFCLAWKQVRLGGTNKKLKALESIIIVLTLTHFIYTLAQYLGDTKRGADNTTGGRNKALNPNSPAAASAV